jgi:hypothetical protein
LELRRLERDLRALDEERLRVEAGRGRLGDPDLARAARDLIHAREEALQAERFSADASASWRVRRHWRHEATTWRRAETAAQVTYERIAEPEIARLDDRIGGLSDRRDELRSQAGERARWLAEHPEVGRRVGHLDRELSDLDAQAHAEREFSQLIARAVATALRPDLAAAHDPTPGAGVDRGMDLGL